MTGVMKFMVNEEGLSLECPRVFMRVVKLCGIRGIDLDGNFLR